MTMTAAARAPFEERLHPRGPAGRWARKGSPISDRQLAALATPLRPARLSDLDPATPLVEVEFSVLDIETTGLDPSRDHIVQIANVRCRGDGAVTQRWSTYVCPVDGNCGGAGAEIHRIPPHLIRGAPSFAEIAPELASGLDGSVVVAHNLDFDLGFLKAESRACGRRVPDAARLCTRNLAKEAGPAGDHHDHHDLGFLCGSYGVPILNAHRADADAEATAALLPRLLHRLGCSTVGDLLGLSAMEGDSLAWSVRRGR